MVVLPHVLRYSSISGIRALVVMKIQNLKSFLGRDSFAERILAPLIPALGCASLVGAAFIVAQSKRLWNDEILSLVLIQDPSFSHMINAWGDTFNQAPPLYFILAWGWDKVFGSSDLSVRLVGSLCLCIALLVTWRCLRRIWGPSASAIGTVGLYCLSSLVLYHNTEARMYGLFVLTCSSGEVAKKCLTNRLCPRPHHSNRDNHCR